MTTLVRGFDTQQIQESDAKRQQVLLDLLIAADAEGNPPEALRQLQAFVERALYTKAEMSAVVDAFKRLKAQQTQLQSPQTQLQTEPQPPAPQPLATAPQKRFYTSSIGGPTPPGQEPVLSDPDGSSLTVIDSESIFHAFGKRMEQVFQTYNCPVWYLNKYTETNRFHKFVFGWAPPLKWNTLSTLKMELMSHVHVRDERGEAMTMPEKDIFIVPRKGSRFEVQIPKDKWKPCNLLDYLVVDGKVDKISPAEPLRVPIGIDLDGEIVLLDLEAGVLLSGMTDSGKSTLQKALLTALMLLYAPSHLQIVPMDFKQGVTFEKFNGLPWVWGGDIIQDDKSALQTIRNLIAEAKRRNEELFKPARVENIREYNAMFPDNPIYWIVVLIDEFAALKSAAGQEALFPLTNEGAATTRSAGIVWIVGTQRPEKRVIDPITRANLGSRIALLVASEADSKIILGEDTREGGQAKYLEGKGDGLLQRGPRLTRFQSFFIDNDVLLSLIDRSRRYYAKFRRPAVTTVKQTLEDLFPVTGDEEEDDPSYTLYLKYRTWAEYNENPANKKKRSQNQLFRELFGHFYDDPRKAHSGANIYTNKDRLQALIKLYEDPTAIAG